MILRATMGKVRLICSIRKVSNVLGVISKLDNGNHVLMWDFDTTDLQIVTHSLSVIQKQYELSPIRILESNSEKGNFHAYCFTQKTWQESVVIVADTKGIDWDFVRLALYRGNFTLRVSSKLGKFRPRLVHVIESEVMPDCLPSDLLDYVDYEIWEKGEIKE